MASVDASVQPETETVHSAVLVEVFTQGRSHRWDLSWLQTFTATLDLIRAGSAFRPADVREPSVCSPLMNARSGAEITRLSHHSEDYINVCVCVDTPLLEKDVFQGTNRA